MEKISDAFAASLAAGAFVVICPACKREDGICHYHAEHDYAVMPLLVVPPTSIKALRGRWRELHAKDSPKPSVASKKVQRRDARKEARRGHRGLARAIVGDAA